MAREFLVALDGSPASDAAARRALELAGALGASVVGVHVLDTAQLEASFIADLSGSVGFQPFLNLSGELRRALQTVGDAIVADFDTKREAAGVAGSAHVVQGLVVAELTRAAARADLIFLGLYGTGERRGKSLGGHADALVRRIAVAAFLASPESDRLRHPLAAFDGSERSTRALKAAAEICRALDVPLDVLTVSTSSDEIDLRRRAAREALEGIDVRSTFVVAQGHPEEAILSRAGENDLVALGSHGHGRIVELVLGSTTERVLRRSTASVLCVP